LNILEQIVEDVRARVKEQARRNPIAKMKIGRPPKRSLCAAIERAPGVPLIAEVKRASPSVGDIELNVDVVEAARAMVRGGAIAISVLTEPKYFKGDPSFVPKIRGAVDVPILRKDFIVDEYQLYESAELGADAVLLIAGILGENLRHFVDLAHELGMESLVEADDEEQVKLASAAGAKMIGINNRDLKTMQVDITRTARLAPLVPDDVVLVSESGIRMPNDVTFVLDAGADAVLVGTTLMKSGNIEQRVRSLVKAR
jgi:indole-3-glycerol phosphate synthase